MSSSQQYSQERSRSESKQPGPSSNEGWIERADQQQQQIIAGPSQSQGQFSGGGAGAGAGDRRPSGQTNQQGIGAQIESMQGFSFSQAGTQAGYPSTSIVPEQSQSQSQSQNQAQTPNQSSRPSQSSQGTSSPHRRPSLNLTPSPHPIPAQHRGLPPSSTNPNLNTHTAPTQPQSQSQPIEWTHESALSHIRAFLNAQSSYDVFPVSFRLIVLDSMLVVKKALSAMLQHGRYPHAPSPSARTASKVMIGRLTYLSQTLLHDRRRFCSALEFNHFIFRGDVYC